MMFSGRRSFSVEKEPKRLLVIWATGVSKARLQSERKFFARFPDQVRDKFFEKAATFLI
jgi:hypothetical protein